MRQLSGPALKVLVELRCRYNGSNNGKVTLSLDEAARLLGLSKTTAKRAFPFPPKPKGMHWKTYRRLERIDERGQAQWEALVLDFAKRF